MILNWYDQSHFKRQPWKNGLGETLELFRIEDPNNVGKFLLRLSMANLDTSGPFSIFPGIDRHLILIEGESLELIKKNGEVRKLLPLDIVSFPGEEIVEGVVSQKCKDFNVMTKRGWKKSSVSVLHLPKKGTLKLSSNSYLFQLSGELSYLQKTKTVGILWEIQENIEIESKSDSISILITLT